MARTLSADLITAQAVRSPKATVTATVANRGLSPNLPAVNWAEVTAPTGTAPLYTSAGVYFSSPNIIQRFKGLNGAIQIQTMDLDSPSADDWHPTTGFSAWKSAYNQAMHIAKRAPTRARFFWTNTSGDIKYSDTGDSGSTWGSNRTYYSGSDAYVDLVAAGCEGHNIGNYICGFTTDTAGTYAAYFGEGANGATPVKYQNNWRAGGIYVDPDDDTYVYCLVFKPDGFGTARIRVLRFDGTTYDEVTNIDQTQAGLLGLDLAACKYFRLNSTDTNFAGSIMETAYGGGIYEGVASVFDDAKSFVTDEPIMFPTVDTYNDRIYSTIVEAGDDLYYFNNVSVYKGTAPTATAETIRPITYTYADNHIELTAGQDCPTVYPGQLLTVRRTLTWNTTTGYEELMFLVTSYRKRKHLTTITGVDALGYLGLMRCRRPYIAATSDVGLTLLMRRLAGRVGVPVSSDHSSIDSLAVLTMTLQPSETLLGAAYRATSQANAWLVPDNTPAFELTLITPGTSTSGDYDDTAHTYPDGEWELIDAEEIVDSQHLAFSYVLGTYSTDPEDGAYVAMAEGPVVGNTHPIPYSITNTRYNTDTRADAAAAAEATRQEYLPIHAVVEIPADLSLELYDVVEVTADHLSWTAEEFRVRRILERWDRGRLTQTVFLGRDP